MYRLTRNTLDYRFEQFYRALNEIKDYKDPGQKKYQSILNAYADLLDWLSGKPINFGSEEVPYRDSISMEDLVNQTCKLFSCKNKNFFPFILNERTVIDDLIKCTPFTLGQKQVQLNFQDYIKLLVQALKTKNFELIEFLSPLTNHTFKSQFQKELSSNEQFSIGMLYEFVQSAKNGWNITVYRYIEEFKLHDKIPTIIELIQKNSKKNSIRSKNQIKHLEEVYQNKLLSNNGDNQTQRSKPSYRVNSPYVVKEFILIDPAPYPNNEALSRSSNHHKRSEASLNKPAKKSRTVETEPERNDGLTNDTTKCSINSLLTLGTFKKPCDKNTTQSVTLNRISISSLLSN